VGAIGSVVLVLLAGLAACDQPPGEVVVLTLTARPARAGPAVASPTGHASSPAAAASGPSATAAPSPTATPTARVLTTGLDGAQRVTVTEAIDGDTLRVEIDGVVALVRVIGIDAPELADAAAQRELAEAAQGAAAAWLARGPIELVADVEPREPDDGRLLRYVRRGASDLSVDLARAGLARALPIAPNLAQRDAIAAAVDEARAQSRGLWALVAGLGLHVDKVAERVTVTNRSGREVTLAGWWLVSLRGGQAFKLPSDTALAAGASLTVSSAGEPGSLRWPGRNVWNNSRADPGELRMPDGRVAAVWDDPSSD